MKVLKLVFGILASLYVVAQIASLAIAIATHRIDFNTPYATGQVIGSLTGIVLGGLLAIVCFKKKSENKG